MKRLRLLICSAACALASSSCATPESGPGAAVPDGATRRALEEAGRPMALPPLPAEADKPSSKGFRQRLLDFFSTRPTEPTK